MSFGGDEQNAISACPSVCRLTSAFADIDVAYAPLDAVVRPSAPAAPAASVSKAVAAPAV